MNNNAIYTTIVSKFVYVFSKRTNCAKNADFEKYANNAVAYAWFIWIKGYNGEPVIRWI